MSFFDPRDYVEDDVAPYRKGAAMEKYEDKLKAFRDRLVNEFNVAEFEAQQIVHHAHDIVESEKNEVKTAAEGVLAAMAGHMELHPFVYCALGTIALSALVIALLFVAKF